MSNRAALAPLSPVPSKSCVIGIPGEPPAHSGDRSGTYAVLTMSVYNAPGLPTLDFTTGITQNSSVRNAPRPLPFVTMPNDLRTLEDGDFKPVTETNACVMVRSVNFHFNLPV